MKNKSTKAYGLTELMLAIVLIAVFAGIAISMFSNNAQNKLAETNLNTTGQTIAEIYKDNFNAVSQGEVTALLSSKENFINGFIPFYITFNFLYPKFFVGLYIIFTNFPVIPMPEFAVTKHSNTFFYERDIWTPIYFFDVFPISDTTTPKSMP